MWQDPPSCGSLSGAGGLHHGIVTYGQGFELKKRRFPWKANSTKVRGAIGKGMGVKQRGEGVWSGSQCFQAKALTRSEGNTIEAKRNTVGRAYLLRIAHGLPLLAELLCVHQ